MRYTLICANILIIVLVSLTTIRGLIKINDRSYFDALTVKKSSSSAQSGKQETKGVKYQSIALIIDSSIRYFNALLGLWAGVKFAFNYLIGYGISLIVSLVLTICVGLGFDSEEIDEFDVGGYTLGVFPYIYECIPRAFGLSLVVYHKKGYRK